jgi:hypothetical protein
MRTIEFVPKAFKEYQDWIETDRKTALELVISLKIFSVHLSKV